MEVIDAIGGENQVKYCDDGHRCENGSLCVENPYDEGNYYCDCDTAFKDMKVYQGLYCEHAATSYCSFDGSLHRDSFCTNRGECRGKVGGEGADHPGCDCPDEYEGDHCQFVSGTKPENWPDLEVASSAALSNSSQQQNPSSKNSNKGGSILLILLICVGVLALVAVRLKKEWQKKNSAEKEIFQMNEMDEYVHDEYNDSSGVDMDIDMDGESLQEIIAERSNLPTPEEIRDGGVKTTMNGSGEIL